jgi:serine/threonine-protein kinase/endoribonuclease IRE1
MYSHLTSWYSVAVLDVLKTPSRAQPFVLLQPHPRLEDVFGAKELTHAARKGHLPNLERAFVGLTDGGSLFAMSPARYPLVMFADWSRAYSPSADADDRPLTVDEMARRRALTARCGDGASMDPACLVGPKRLDASGSGLSRLLIDATKPEPVAALEPPRTTMLQTIGQHAHNATTPTTEQHKPFDPTRGFPALPPSTGLGVGIPSGLEVQSAAVMAVASLGFLLALFWFKRNAPLPVPPVAPPQPVKPPPAVAADPAPEDKRALAAVEGSAAPIAVDFVHISVQDALPDPPATPMTPAANGDANDEESDNEGAGEEGAGHRRKKPRRRGKKKRSGAKEASEDAGAEPANVSSSDEKVPASPPLVVLPPILPPAVPPSLVVSDEILGNTQQRYASTCR